MRTKTSALILAVALALFSGLPLTPISPAYAVCSIGAPQELERGALRGIENSDLVLVGSVTEERSMRRIGSSVLYESVVAPAAILHGEMPEGEVAIPFLSELGGDCSGGPRMEAGETVLLALSWRYTSPAGDGSREFAWQLHGVYGKVRLEGGQAISQTDSREVVLGETVPVVRAFAEAVGASEQRTDRAVAAASTTVPFDASRSWYWALLPVAVLATVVLVVFVIRTGTASRRPR